MSTEKGGKIMMDDKDYADDVKRALSNLHDAVGAARRKGLKIEISNGGLKFVGELPVNDMLSHGGVKFECRVWREL